MNHQKENEPRPRPIKVLWVDDRAPERLEPYEELLKKGLGGKIEFVLSGPKALEILEREAEEGILPDLIISDFDMPGMNGLEFVKAVKNHENEKIRSLPICIVSGLVLVSEENKLRQLGIPVFNFEDAFLKPQIIRQLCEASS